MIGELKLAARRLLKRPGAVLASVVTLAVGIGAATAAWSLLSAVLLHPLPVQAADRLVAVGTRTARDRGVSNQHLYPLYTHLRDGGVFQSVAAWGTVTLLVNPWGGSAAPERTVIHFVSANYFDVLGVHLPRGRVFSPDDDRRGAPLTVVISHRYWRDRLSEDAGAIGRPVAVNNQPATVVGIAPAGFRGLNLADAPDVFMPLNTVADAAGPPTNFFADRNPQMSPTAWMNIVGALRPGQTPDQATAALTGLAPIRETEARTFDLTALTTSAIPEIARAGVAQFGRLLGSTVGLLLLIGCLTVGMLLLLRTEARRGEFAMCLALGATRGRLARGVAIEGALLAAGGAILALPVAWWLFRGVRIFSLPGGLPIDLLELSIDGRALATAAMAALAATLVIAIVAGVFGFSANLADTLRARSGGTPRVTRRRTRAILVAAQAAVALVLIGGAALFGKSVTAALSLNKGFETRRILTGAINLRPYGYTPLRAAAFFTDVRGLLQGNPLIRSMSVTSQQGGMGGRLVVDGTPRQLPVSVAFHAIDDQYFSTMGMLIASGRNLMATDSEQAPLVAVVNRSFGRWLANGQDPVGHRITMPFSRPGQPPPIVEVVGVVPDVVVNVERLEPMVMYMPLAQQAPPLNFTLVLHAAGDADAARLEVLRAIRHVDARINEQPMLSIDERIEIQMSPQRFGRLVMGALGGIALLLTVLGTYVLAESMAAVRMREMGIRAALGATGRQLGTIVLAEMVKLIGAGLGAGLLLAWIQARSIRAFLFHVQPLDAVTLTWVASTILAVALAVSVRPARRAARVDLARVLKDE